MEISLEAIISLLGLFVGGGGGAFFTWRYMRRKAKAEAESAEVDTVKNMQDVVSNMQGAYDKMLDQVNHYIEDATSKIEEMRSERDRYKKECDEWRDRFERLENTLHQMRTEYQAEKSDTDRKIAQLGRKVEAMRPFLCGDMLCKKRQRVALLEGVEVEQAKPTTRRAKSAKEPNEIEPINQEEMS